MATGGRRGRAVPLSKSFSRRLRHGRTGFGGSGHARGMMQLDVASAPSRCRHHRPTGGEETDGARWERRSGGRRCGGGDDGDDAGAGEQGGGGGEMRSSVGAGSGSTAVDGGHRIVSRPNAGIARPCAISPTAVMNCNAPRAEGRCGSDGVTDGYRRGGSGEAAEEGEIEDDGAEERRKWEADMDCLTCGVYVGPTLTQPPHRTKPGSKLPRDLKRTVLLVEGRLVSGFVIGGRFCISMTS
uniref:Uncharacterized protein n=1 Tax=Oryza barthii TaxID=65489 RepID=A0A0D3GFQ4_9ORYZ